MTLYPINKRFVIVDEGERPTTGYPTNSILYDTTTKKFYQWNGTTWDEVTSSGGGGSSTFVGLTDVDWTGAQSGNVPTWNGTELVPQDPPGSGGGEANTLDSVGTGEGTLHGTKVGTVLNIKSLKQGSNVTLANNASDVTITSAYPPDASNSVKGIVELSESNGSESGGGRAVQDNDPRLSNSRTPTAHVHSGADITSGTVPIVHLPTASETAKGIAELATSAETTAGLVVQASDTRLSDPRTPTAHVHSGGDITSGTVPAAQLPNASNTVKGAVITSNPNGSESAGTKVVLDSDTRLTNSRTPTAHNHAAGDITTGILPVGRGGTSKTSITTNALLIGNGTGIPNEVTVGSENQVLAVVSGTPTYKSLDSEKTGKAVASGNGSTTQFIIPHGVSGVTSNSYAFVDCASHAIGRTWTIDATNITVNFVTAPSSGTNNVIIYWRVII